MPVLSTSYFVVAVPIYLFFKIIWIYFWSLTFMKNWNKSLFETLIQFNFPVLEMFGFSTFNQILLSLFDVSNTSLG